jgi:hypothetical protein
MSLQVADRSDRWDVQTSFGCGCSVDRVRVGPEDTP